METLWLPAFKVSREDLSVFKRCDNITNVHLHYTHGLSVDHALSPLRSLPKLRRLTLVRWRKVFVPSIEVLCDFIMEKQHLTYLRIISIYDPKCDHFKSLLDEVNEIVLPCRPNFKFSVSCCSDYYDDPRVPREFFIC